MRITNEMLAKIHEWTNQDRIIIARTTRLAELGAERRAAWEEYRKAGEAMLWQNARDIKSVDWRLSLGDRRKAVNACTLNSVEAFRAMLIDLRRKVRKLDTAIEQTVWVIGKRRGYLRSKFEQRFVLLAQRERIRMQRCAVPA